MYPLPPELAQKIRIAIIDAGFDEHDDRVEDLFDYFAALLVRENRKMRQQIGELWRNFSKAADSDEVDYGDSRAAAGGEFTCEHIVNEIIKPGVYFNNEEAEKRTEAVDRLIEDLYSEDDEE